MPQKRRADRIRHAKAAGVSMMIRENDLESARASRHATKKSRHVLAPVAFEDRRVRPRPAPGRGRWGRRTVASTAAEVAIPELGHRGASVRGRKKAPSRMHIKSKGGPRKRPRYQGG